MEKPEQQTTSKKKTKETKRSGNFREKKGQEFQASRDIYIREQLFLGCSNAEGALPSVGEVGAREAIPLPITTRGVALALFTWQRPLASSLQRSRWMSVAFTGQAWDWLKPGWPDSRAYSLKRTLFPNILKTWMLQILL